MLVHVNRSLIRSTHDKYKDIRRENSTVLRVTNITRKQILFNCFYGIRNKTNRLTSGEILINSLDHNFKFGFRTSSRNVINNPHGCGRLATSRSSKTLQKKTKHY